MKKTPFNLFELILIAISFTLLFVYIFLNLQTITQSSGNIYVYSSFLIMLLYPIVSIWKAGRLFKVWLVLVIVIVYIFYFLVFPYGDLSLVNDYFLGSKSGILFSLLLGFLVCATTSRFFYLYTISSSITRVIQIVFFLALATFSAYSSYLSLLVNGSEVRDDIFLVGEELKGLYQRPGAFMLIQSIILSTFAVFFKRVGVRKVVVIAIFCLLTVDVIVKFIFSQLLGSNSGALSVLAIYLITFYFLFSLEPEYVNRVSLFSTFFKGMKKFLRTVFTFTCTIFIFSLFFSFSFELPSLRVFNFGGANTSGGLSGSFSSRFSLFVNNFATHLDYNPVFGSFIVEKLTTGEGTYVHSFLSIFTHLGLVGGGLILSAFVMALSKLYRSSNCSYTSYMNDIYMKNFRLATFYFVFILSLISAFFAWMPLWFTVGYLLIPPVKSNFIFVFKQRIE
ncbi:hypothetical protein [Vibrio mediterranei]|uniref:Oligosaccharide repeat unit polymerase n=1 Tax=Vibrio mediterranei TaxID=689 RepID=A0ABX5DDR9_9VIBR|nr:hypothetical protein [Vibrio mediterranei]PCD87714.1 hypothetical protein COR52_15065 [Vibrio mediterranei]PRQ67338.1 hypothetical protein COR51_12250 [Vibrio mediterranei]